MLATGVDAAKIMFPRAKNGTFFLLNYTWVVIERTLKKYVGQTRVRRWENKTAALQRVPSDFLLNYSLSKSSSSGRHQSMCHLANSEDEDANDTLVKTGNLALRLNEYCAKWVWLYLYLQRWWWWWWWRRGTGGDVFGTGPQPHSHFHPNPLGTGPPVNLTPWLADGQTAARGLQFLSITLNVRLFFFFTVSWSALHPMHEAHL